MVGFYRRHAERLKQRREKGERRLYYVLVVICALIALFFWALLRPWFSSFR